MLVKKHFSILFILILLCHAIELLLEVLLFGSCVAVRLDIPEGTRNKKAKAPSLQPIEFFVAGAFVNEEKGPDSGYN